MGARQEAQSPAGIGAGGALALTLPAWLTYNHMVVGSRVASEDTDRSEQTDRMFRALADPTRRDIVVRAMSGELSVSDLARHYPMSFAAVQKHVAVLEEARLVTKQRRGRRQIVSTDIEAVRAARIALDRLETIWRQRMEQFGEVLVELEESENE